MQLSHRICIVRHFSTRAVKIEIKYATEWVLYSCIVLWRRIIIYQSESVWVTSNVFWIKGIMFTERTCLTQICIVYWPWNNCFSSFFMTRAKLVIFSLQKSDSSSICSLLYWILKLSNSFMQKPTWPRAENFKRNTYNNYYWKRIRRRQISFIRFIPMRFCFDFLDAKRSF